MKRHFVLGCTLLACAATARADVIFDTKALSQPCAFFCVDEQRGSSGNYAAVLSFSADVTVTRIGVWSSVDDPQNVKFLVFDSQLNGGTGDVLFSQTKAFAAAPAAFLYTDPISFTFLAGKTYDIGILGDGQFLTGSWSVGDVTANGITAISTNANINDFAAPSTGGYSGVVPYIQLETAGAAIPEPASWAMLIVGFGLTGAAMRRRRLAVVA